MTRNMEKPRALAPFHFHMEKYVGGYGGGSNAGKRGRGRSCCCCWLQWYAVIFAVFALWFLLLSSHPPSLPPTSSHDDASPSSVPHNVNPAAPDPCLGKYVYVHDDLPSRFNSDMLRDCGALSRWTDMCLFTSNAGLGPPLDGGAFSVDDPGCWYNTNQFAVEVIFHNRMKRYRCLTRNSSAASAVFVPFYAGLDVSRFLWGYNTSVRDSASLDLIRWVTSRPEWARMGGRDHFMVGGRITWDFRRLTDEEPNWGNKLLLLPEARNMTMLVIEASPWHSNDFGIPYPTYFHPSSNIEIYQWQKRVRGAKGRRWLFSFAGAPRPNQTESIRGRIIEQCRRAPKRCALLECDAGASKCHSPASVMRLFQSSVFCLQPQGDSYTRRSAFDAMVAGCVPVFFHPGSAYVQYLWHLPKDYTKYSVFISEDDVRDGKVSIEEVLGGIGEEKVREMRREIVRMIPRLIYADPRSGSVNVKDAFDVAVEGVIERVERFRNERSVMGENREFQEENSWKYALVGNEEPHEWDHFFTKQT